MSGVTARLGGILAIAALAGLTGCQKSTSTKSANAAEVRAIPVTVASVRIQKVERSIPVTGTLRGWEQVSIGSKRAGRILKILHDMGDRVEPGEPLVELETIDSELAIMQAERQLQAELAKLGLSTLPTASFEISSIPAWKQAQVALDTAVRDLNRLRGLTQRAASSVQELQDAEDKVRTATAALDSAGVNARSTLANALAAKVALDVARQNQADMTIRVPVPTNIPKSQVGKVKYAITSRPVAEGQMLQAGAEVMTLVVEDPLRVWVKVPERYISQIALDQPVRVSVSAYPDKEFQGKVTRINPSVEEASRTFQVEVQVPNAEGKLRPGGFAEAEIVVAAEDDAIVVPLEAIAELAGVTKVFVVEQGVSRAVPVSRGVEGPGWIEVKGNVPRDATVVTTGQVQLALLADGTAVRVREPETKSAKPGESPGKTAPADPEKTAKPALKPDETAKPSAK